MSEWTLGQIRLETRRVSGRLSDTEMSTAELDMRINQYYTLQFPAEVKLERNHVYYEFPTLENQQVYPLPDGFTNIEPEAFADNLRVQWYQDPSIFYNENPQNYSAQTVATGDGSTTVFNSSFQQTPLLPGSFVASDGVETFMDENTTWTTSNVLVTGSLGGTATINYSSGVFSLSFATAPPNGASIRAKYIHFVSGRPISMLVYNNEMKFYPVPDDVYKIRVKSWQYVPALTSANDRPLRDQWGWAIVYGTALLIHTTYAEWESVAAVQPLHKKQLNLCLRETHQYLLNTRTQPQF